ncbi:UTRA domain-containing protein [Oscillospiraceae bacterium LCP21S3_E10]
MSVRSALAALEELYIPYSVVPGLEEVDIKLFSIYDIYQWNGIVLGEGHQTLRITRLPPMLAKHMDVPPEQAVMEFSCTTRDRGGRVVEFSRCYVRNDKAEFVVHFRHTNP